MTEEEMEIVRQKVKQLLVEKNRDYKVKALSELLPDKPMDAISDETIDDLMGAYASTILHPNWDAREFMEGIWNRLRLPTQPTIK